MPDSYPKTSRGDYRVFAQLDWTVTTHSSVGSNDSDAKSAILIDGLFPPGFDIRLSEGSLEISVTGNDEHHGLAKILREIGDAIDSQANTANLYTDE